MTYYVKVPLPSVMFPNMCPLCEGHQAKSRIVLKTVTGFFVQVHWSIEVPVCNKCRKKLILSNIGGVLLFGSPLILVVLAVILALQGAAPEDFYLSKPAIGLLIIAFGLLLFLAFYLIMGWQKCYRRFQIAHINELKSVTFSMHSESYASQFAEINNSRVE